MERLEFKSLEAASTDFQAVFCLPGPQDVQGFAARADLILLRCTFPLDPTYRVLALIIRIHCQLKDVSGQDDGRSMPSMYLLTQRRFARLRNCELGSGNGVELDDARKPCRRCYNAPQSGRTRWKYPCQS